METLHVLWNFKQFTRDIEGIYLLTMFSTWYKNVILFTEEKNPWIFPKDFEELREKSIYYRDDSIFHSLQIRFKSTRIHSTDVYYTASL